MRVNSTSETSDAAKSNSTALNMAVQQCLACNAMVNGTCRICICGHVFDEIKEIGGRRFSDYRAMLYTRLENRRIKNIMKEMKRSEALGSSDEENTVNNKVYTKPPQKAKSVLKPRPHYIKKTKKRRKGKVHHQNPAFLATKTFHRRYTRPVPTELSDRLPKALAEINRRLLGQSLLWAEL